jgi:hypothetical protein
VPLPLLFGNGRHPGMCFAGMCFAGMCFAGMRFAGMRVTGMHVMGDPLVIASIALGLSVIASAIRMVDWFLHADPRVAAQVTRWAMRGVAALSVPLLLVLLLKEQWTAATAIAAAMVLVPAVLGPRLWRWVGVPPFAGYSAPVSSANRTEQSFVDEAELVRYSAAVLDAYLRRAAATQPAAGNEVPAISYRVGETGGAEGKGRASRKGNGGASKTNGIIHASNVGDANGMGDANGIDDASGNGHAETFGLGAMTEEEARAVLGVGRGATEAEIRAAHGRIGAMVSPANGGSPYLAIKVDQAKEILVRAAAPSADAPPKAPRKRSASRRRPSPST